METGMAGVKEIIKEAESLPIEERVIVIDSLLQTINPPLAGVEIEWVKVAKRRLRELRSGKVKAVPGNEVFEKIRTRFAK
jgi:Putative addiction module component.